MMRKTARWSVMLLIVWCGVAPSLMAGPKFGASGTATTSNAADDESADIEEPYTDDEVVIKTDEGSRLLLPKDWPVKREHGVVSPIPIEQYLSMKFGQVREKTNDIDQRVEVLEQRVQHLEEDNKALQRWLRLFEAREQQKKEVTDGHTTQN